MKKLHFSGPAILTGILAQAPYAAWAQQSNPVTTVPAGRYSDRDRSVDWNKQKAVLTRRNQGAISPRAGEDGLDDHSGQQG
jgi:hypothetical protein